MFNKEIISRFADTDTPFYYYDLDLLDTTLSSCRSAAHRYGFHVHYAMKANFNQKVLEAVCRHGLGADCVSGNEVRKAIEIGFDPQKVVFAGVGKSDKEINEALDRGIFCFNAESVQELGIINKLAEAKNTVARVALRINPNVDAHTHHHITTGLEENKFGINQWELNDCIDSLQDLDNIECIGIHFHVGSQVTNLEVFKSLYLKVLNVGGGLGVDYYHPDENPVVDFQSYFQIFDQFLIRKPGQEVHFELGRALVAQCGSLISRVLYVKNGLKKNFLILDAGMTELMRPMLYQAYHKIENLSAISNQQPAVGSKYDVVGPICESTDCFGKEVELPESHRGDLIAIRTAGAYGEVMASGYNLRDQVRSVYKEGVVANSQ